MIIKEATDNNKYRILMFTPLFAPYANPEAMVNNKLVLAFLNAGWDVDVISREQLPINSGYNYGAAWEDPWTPLKEITHEISYELGGYIRRRYETARDGFRMGYPLIGCRWAAHAFDLALKLHKQKPYHVILSRALPDSGHLPALNLAKKTNLPWIANWNDASDNKNPPPAGAGPDASLGFFHDRFLNEVGRHATWHTFPSDRMRSHICKYLKNSTEQRSSTIPHVAFKQGIKEKTRMYKEFTLCYAGNLYAGRNPDLLFNSIRSFLNIKPQSNSIKLIIVGLESIGLTNLLQTYDLQHNVIITGPVSYNETLKYCSCSDVLLVLEAAFTDGIFLPSKFVDYVQCGKPILAISPENGTLKDILTKYGGGLAVDCTSVQEITNALIELHDKWSKDLLNNMYSSDKLFKFYDPMTIISCYKNIFNTLIN